MEIEGYEGHYTVTEDGRVYSHPRTMHSPHNTFGAQLKGRWLKASPNTQGYLKVTLHLDGKASTIPVHKLVAQAFIPNPHNKPRVTHLDGNKLNNSVVNLQWTTHKENMAHAISLGLYDDSKLLGEDNPSSKLTEQQVVQIRTSSDSNLMEAIKHTVSKTTIKLIRSYKSWKQL